MNCRHPGLCAWMGRVRLGVHDTISGDSAGLRRSAPVRAGLRRSAPDEFQKSRFDRQAADFSLLDHPCLNILHLSCLSSRHLSCLSSRHLSCLNRRHLQQQTSNIDIWAWGRSKPCAGLYLSFVGGCRRRPKASFPKIFWPALGYPTLQANLLLGHGPATHCMA